MSGNQSLTQTVNDSQWLGNYVSAGVTGVAMDLRIPIPFGPLPMRIAIREATGDSSTTPGYCSTTAFNLTADGNWHHVVFPLDAASMTAINSPKQLSVDLANVVDFRLLSSPAPSVIGFGQATEFYVDNIAAVPEPASIGILLSGIVGLALLRRHRTQRFK